MCSSRSVMTVSPPSRTVIRGESAIMPEAGPAKPARLMS
jgi:hypothetical protein